MLIDEPPRYRPLHARRRGAGRTGPPASSTPIGRL